MIFVICLIDYRFYHLSYNLYNSSLILPSRDRASKRYIILYNSCTACSCSSMACQHHPSRLPPECDLHRHALVLPLPMRQGLQRRWVRVRAGLRQALPSRKLQVTILDASGQIVLTCSRSALQTFKSPPAMFARLYFQTQFAKMYFWRRLQFKNHSSVNCCLRHSEGVIAFLLVSFSANASRCCFEYNKILYRCRRPYL